MRKIALIFGILSLFSVYLFACGALNPEASGDGFSTSLLAPFREFSLLGASVLVVGVIFMAATIAAAPDSGESRSASVPRLSWPAAVNLAFLVNALVVAGIGGLLLWDVLGNGDYLKLGIIYMAGVYEAVLGAILIVFLIFCPRPRLVFLPAMGLYLVGLTALGLLVWLGSGASA